jgi:uncharacterized protein (TIGR00725 family)
MNDRRRYAAAVIGDARCSEDDLRLAEALGRAVIDGGFRLVTGGLDGVMRAASRGARSAEGHRPGDVIGILPTYSADDANEFVEVAICTGMNHARNVVVVASADVVFAFGGKSGTLSEIALAWKLGKPIIAVGDAPGWAGRLAGAPVDDRRPDQVHGPLPPTEAVRLALELLASPRAGAKGF